MVAQATVHAVYQKLLGVSWQIPNYLTNAKELIVAAVVEDLSSADSFPA